MQFTMQFWPGIEDGSITVAFRRWRNARVVAGRTYRTPAGRIEIERVEEVEPGQITDRDAVRSGHTSGDAIRASLRGEESWPTFRIEFHRLDGPDPREVLANTSELSDEDVAEITERLDRLDRASRHGPWTRETLGLIHAHPHRRAPDLATMVGRETGPFKLDVRKLKNLGLTQSFNPGYRLSPRGAAYLGVAYEPPPHDAALPTRGG
jgi:hypothetical protein